MRKHFLGGLTAIAFTLAATSPALAAAGDDDQAFANPNVFSLTYGAVTFDDGDDDDDAALPDIAPEEEPEETPKVKKGKKSKKKVAKKTKKTNKKVKKAKKKKKVKKS